MSLQAENRADDGVASSWHRHLQRLGLEPVVTLVQQKRVWEAKQAQLRMQARSVGSRRRAIRGQSAQLTSFLVEHTVAAGETLAQIATRYYGSCTRDKWLMIYELNKGVIGVQPTALEEGQVLRIPVWG